jgi:hypothetical protein
LAPADADDDELVRVVARIRARGAEKRIPKPPAEAVAHVIAHLDDEEPLSVSELDEHERLWRAVEDEMRAWEQADDRAERLS